MSADHRKYIAVGRVVGIYRYPVKSMGGEALQEAHLGWHGIAGDRRFAFLRADDPSGLPWLSAREVPLILGYRAMFRADQDVERGNVTVITPDAHCTPVRSDELLEEIERLSGTPLRLVRLHRGTFDSMAVSIISTASIDTVAHIAERELDVRRFRPNVLIEATGDHPFPEDRWVGDLLVFGEGPDAARVRVNRRDPRCSIVNVCPDTLGLDRTVLRAIVRERKNLCGVYGSAERTGTIKLDDIIWRRKH